MSLEQRRAMRKIRQEIREAHELFSSAEDAQHAYLDMAELAIDRVLADPCYGYIQRD